LQFGYGGGRRCTRRRALEGGTRREVPAVMYGIDIGGSLVFESETTIFQGAHDLGAMAKGY
jgi:hypothetical protein